MKKTRKIVVPIPGTLDWELLRRFNVITHSTSFGEAAEKVGTSQQALLRHMDDLEEFLGQKLFTTTAKYRSMELTPEGQTLSLITEQMAEVLNKQIIKNIKKTPEEERKTVLTILTTPGLATTLLLEPISVFLQDHINIRLELSAHPNLKKLNVGEVSIRGEFLSQKNIKTVLVFSYDVAFYASSKYLQRFGMPGSSEELVKHKILSFKDFNINTVEQYALLHNIIYFEPPAIQSDYGEFLVAMALRGQGIIEIPDIHPATKNLEKITSIPSYKKNVFASYLDVAEQEPIVYDFIKAVQRKENK